MMHKIGIALIWLHVSLTFKIDNSQNCCLNNKFQQYSSGADQCHFKTTGNESNTHSRMDMCHISGWPVLFQFFFSSSIMVWGEDTCRKCAALKHAVTTQCL